RQMLERLNLDQSLLAVFRALERAESEFVSNLKRKIASSEDHHQLARTVVDQLARFYQFQNVSIFKVNALRGHVRLLAQALGPEGGTPMPEGYTQAIERGLLGRSYRRGEPVILKAVGDGSEEAEEYVTVAPEIRSELCIPIRLFKRVLWILNLEDRHTDAF